ncbi:MAG TPA: M28 family peptidase [Acidobacteriota bacterium]|nr:M28 family peptidase [Acidobacteriota bacterium]
MDLQPKRIMTGAFVVVLLAWLIASLLFSGEEPDILVNQDPLSFDAENAYRIAKEFVTENPGRVFGSLESRQSTGYLHDALTASGYEIEYTHFEARIGGRPHVGRNVLAFKKGETTEVLAVTAHYDTVGATVEGAMKNGAAVGVLLELARGLRETPTRRSLLFVFTDGGEWGSIGARDIASGESHEYDIAAVLSLDRVGIGELAAFRLGETGQLKGFTPRWLRELALRAAETEGLPVKASSGLKEYLERTWLIPRTEQGPFLSAGIAAINLGSVSSNLAREKAIYHSPEDTMENITVDGMRAFGRAAERIIRTIDALPAIPRESPDAFRMRDSVFMGSTARSALHILSFLPLPVFFCLLLLRQRPHLHSGRIGREMLLLSMTFLPFLAAYFCLQLCFHMRLFPLYTLYPPAANHPVIENPAWGIVWVIFGTAVFVGLICFLIARFNLKYWPKPDFISSKFVLSAFLLITVFFALLHNTYWAMTFMLLPAWLWTIIGNGETAGKRLINRVWVLVAAVPCMIALVWFASGLGLGLNFIWYQILALTTGLFSTSGFFIGALAVALGLRFLAIQSHEGPAASSG